MLLYFLRTICLAVMIQHAQRINALIWEALLDFSEVPLEDRNNDAQRTVFADAKCQVTLPISEGGFGLTPNECVATTAFYSGVSHALRFALNYEVCANHRVPGITCLPHPSSVQGIR